MTLKNRGQLKKTEGQTAPKSRGCTLAVGTSLQRGSVPTGNTVTWTLLLSLYSTRRLLVAMGQITEYILHWVHLKYFSHK